MSHIPTICTYFQFGINWNIFMYDVNCTTYVFHIMYLSSYVDQKNIQF